MVVLVLNLNITRDKRWGETTELLGQKEASSPYPKESMKERESEGKGHGWTHAKLF